MKAIFLSLILAVSATEAANQPKCVDEAVKHTVFFNAHKHGVGTNSCGIKALNIGHFYETYLVCTSDETESTEYVVTVDSKTCVAEYTVAATESSTPNFENTNGLLKSVSCDIDSSDYILNCK